MERTPAGRAVIVCDTCVLINFLIANRLELLSRNPDYRFVVTEHVASEVTEPDQRRRLTAAIENGEIEQVDLTDPEALSVFAELSVVLGSGEAAAIALAAQKNWAVATDEGGRTRREIFARLGQGRLLTTPGILLRAIQSGLLTVAEADAIKAKLELFRFKMAFASFGDLTR